MSEQQVVSAMVAHATAQQVMSIPIAELHLGAFGPNPNKMDGLRYKLLVKNLLDQKAKSWHVANGESPQDTELLQPVLVQSSTLNVIDGEHRVLAASEAGWTHVTCRLVDCDAAGARALRLGMNQIRGETDLTIAASELDFLSKEGWSPDDLSLTGFTGEEITTLLDMGSPLDQDMAQGAAAQIANEETEDREERTEWVLEISFKDKKTYQRIKRRLKRLAGKGKELSEGLIKAIAED